MATIITMPSVVADATAADLLDWLVQVGEDVEQGQPIAEIETEKATIELEAETAGTVTRLLVDPGSSVPVGEPIAVLTAPGEDAAEADQALAAAESAQDSTAAHDVPHDTEAPATDEDTRDHAVDDAPRASDDRGPSPTRVFSSPLARKRAKDLGVDVSTLQGSGPHGRILRADVEAVAAGSAAPMRAGEDAPATTAVSEPTTPSRPAAPATGAGEDVPLSGMRRAIARRLTESKTTVPHFYVSVDVEMDALLDLRGQVNESLAGAGLKATVNDLILKALAGALTDVPEANVTWQGDSMRRHSAVDVSVAIATDDGLLTPVLRDLGRTSLTALCQTMADFKERAAAGRIRQPELEGGAFSLTNLGMYGTREFAAILNPPQSGILAVGAAEPRPVVRDGELAVATVMSCTLSADHRVIDGAVAARLLEAFRRRVEDPMRILL